MTWSTEIKKYKIAYGDEINIITSDLLTASIFDHDDNTQQLNML